MKKGVILEIKSQYLVMLTPDGEFLKGKKAGSNYQVGEEIYFYTYDAISKQKRYTLWTLTSSIAAVFLISIMLFNPFEKDRAYAYVTMDMDPSIEFVLDKNLHVIGTNAYNQAGEKVLSLVKIGKNQSFTNAAKTIMNTCDSMGYLNRQQNIVIASITNDEKHDNDHRLEKEVKKIRTAAEKIKAKIEIVKGSMKERNTARKKGISAGEFIINKNKTNKTKSSPSSQTINMDKNTVVKTADSNKKMSSNKNTMKSTVDTFKAENRLLKKELVKENETEKEKKYWEKHHEKLKEKKKNEKKREKLKEKKKNDKKAIKQEKKKWRKDGHFKHDHKERDRKDNHNYENRYKKNAKHKKQQYEKEKKHKENHKHKYNKHENKNKEHA
ncbi:anti-sigma factor domain-containing protein [Heyndrickxia sp. NPDC080065]|uniref:anti-sigma factor domain-containing protein n=1 Tax=Heyndrickxia sp. NPDC080065 TaxID=3390568 RepID=UPI003D06E49A